MTEAKTYSWKIPSFEINLIAQISSGLIETASPPNTNKGPPTMLMKSKGPLCVSMELLVAEESPSLLIVPDQTLDFIKNERIGLMIPAAMGPVMRSVVRMMMRGSWSEGLLRFSRQVSHAAPAM